MFTSVIIALFIALIYTTTSTYIVAYQQTNGLLLADNSIMGGDFICFYTAGTLANNELTELYNLPRQFLLKDEILSTYNTSISGVLPFVYPPLVAFIFSLLALLPFKIAYTIWALTALVSVTITVLLLARELQLHNRYGWGLIILATFAFLPFSLDTLGGGQLSWIGLIVMGLVTFFRHRKYEFMAGLSLTLGYYKPPLFIFAAVLLVIISSRRFFLGALTGGAILTILTLCYVGPEGLNKYLQVASKYSYGQELAPGIKNSPLEAAGPIGLIAWFVESNNHLMLVFTLAFCTLLGISVVIVGKERLNTALGMAYLFSASLCLSLQLVRYDLCMLLVPFVLVLGSFDELKSDRQKIMVLIIIISFYFEFCFRKIPFMHAYISLSSFLLPLWTALLFHLTCRTFCPVPQTDYLKNNPLKND
jgi:hypothetical protein